jgi:hypothetical protein
MNYMQKKLLLFLAILLLNSETIIRAQQNMFSKVYYDGNTTVGNSVINALDGGYIIAGSNSYAGLIMKIDTAGNQQWRKEIGGQMDGTFNNLISTNDSCYVATGKLFNSATGFQNIVCIKLNMNGDTIWSKTITGSSEEVGHCIRQTYDHGYIITGTGTNNTAPYSNLLAIKIDSVGNLQWRRSFILGNNENIGFSIKQTADSGYIIAGNFSNSAPFSDFATLIKLTNSGNVTWSQKYTRNNISYYCSANDVMELSDGYIALLNVENASVLIKTDLSGNVIWSKTYAGYSYSFCNNCTKAKFEKTSDGNYVFAIGQSMTKVDSSGIVLWQDYVSLYSINAIEAKDHGYLVLGNGPLLGVYPMETYAPQIGVIKTDSIGNVPMCGNLSGDIAYTDSIAGTTITVNSTSGGSISPVYPSIITPLILDYLGCVSFLGSDEGITANDYISLSPNPFSDQLTVSFSAPTSHSTLNLINMLGKKISEYPIPELSTNYSILRGNLHPGIYILQVQTDKELISKKIIIQ